MALGSDISESKQIVESVENNICCICLEPLAKRTHVKLQCSHQYHLDCIGSAFNEKNQMQCPTCRQVEDGEWLYAQPQPIPDPIPLVPDFNFDDWVLEPEQDPLEVSLNMLIQPNMSLHGGQVRRETVLPYAHSYLDSMFPNSNRQHSPQFHAPNKISDVFMMYDAAGHVNPLETRRLQYQLRDNLAWHANQRRLTNMSQMIYGFGGSGGGFSHGGASSSGGNGGWEEVDFANGGGTNRRGRCICGYCNR